MNAKWKQAVVAADLTHQPNTGKCVSNLITFNNKTDMPCIPLHPAWVDIQHQADIVLANLQAATQIMTLYQAALSIPLFPQAALCLVVSYLWSCLAFL